MIFGKKVNNILMLGLVYVLMFHNVIPHCHSHSEESSAVEIFFHSDENHSNHSHHLHSHDVALYANSNSISKDFLDLVFINSTNLIGSLVNFCAFRIDLYTNNTFDNPLLLNCSLRAPPSIG